MTHTSSIQLPFTELLPKTAYAHILDQARDIILLASIDGLIVYANQAAIETYQYSRHELQELSVLDLRAPIKHSDFNAQFKIARQKGILFRTLHLRKDGTLFPVEVSSRSIQIDDQERIISIIRDMSQMSRIEASLQESEEKYNATNENLSASYEELLASEEELRQQFDELLRRDQDLQRKNFLLQSLHESMIELMGDFDSEDILEKLLGFATTLIETSHGFIYRVDQKKQHFVQSHGLGIHQCCNGLSFPFSQGMAGTVYRTKEKLLANDYVTYKKINPPPPCLDDAFKQHHFSFDSVSALLLVPLKFSEQIIGIIGLTLYEPGRTFAPEEVEALVQFSDMASVTIEHTSLLRSYQSEINERRKTEIELRKMQEVNQILVSSIPDPLFIINHHGIFLESKANQDLLYVQPDQFIGKSLFDIFPPDIAALSMHHIQQALQSNTLQTFEYHLQIKEQTLYYEARLIPHTTTEVMAMIRDITERHNMEEQLKYYSLHDSLTDVYNRAYFEEHMKLAAQKQDDSIGLIIFDVDGLKLINDTSGHASGDSVLKYVASILKKSFDTSDVVARIGGDEFAVLLYNKTEKNFESICSQVREQLKEHNQQGIMFPISVSMGYVMSVDQPHNMDSLFIEADTNMYREKLHQKQSVKNATVQVLVKALEARDYLTEGHGDRLQDLVEDFSKSLGLPERQISDLRLLAHFHDIGKVGIPDHILFKPGPLSEEEWVIMRKHTDIGYRIASSVADLSPIAGWILSHHEHWNGKGYPQGLAGEDIPIACRILALVDTYDAMTNDRPYRKAVTPEEAFIELEKFSGIQFDPVFTKKFIQMLSDNEQS